MAIYNPDLMAELIPAKGAAGFEIGEGLDSILKRVGFVEWHDKDSTLDEKLSSNTGWIGVKSRCGLPGGPYTLVQSIIYMNDMICLEFEENLKLYRIDIGKGYGGSFFGVRPGDDLRNLERAGFGILFNDMDDDFLILRNESILAGISFLTDFRTSLGNVSDQIIQYISIYDWSLR